MYPRNRVFAENLVGLGFLQSVSCIKSIPTHEKLFAVGKSGSKCRELFTRAYDIVSSACSFCFFSQKVRFCGKV